MITLTPEDYFLYPKAKIRLDNGGKEYRKVYFNSLIENFEHQHQTKYTPIAEKTVKPLEGNNEGYGRKRSLFANLHQYHYKHFNVNQVNHFEIANMIYTVRNLNMHRGIGTDTLPINSDDKKKLEDFLFNADYMIVYKCLHEVAAFVKEVCTVTGN